MAWLQFHRRNSIFGGVVFSVIVSLAAFGCTVEQTKEGEMPEVDVQTEGGQMPEYDVDWANVDVGVRDTTVTVPDVDVQSEQRQVKVPYIDFNMPAGSGVNKTERTIEVDLDVPEGQSVSIQEVRIADGRLIVISRLSEAGAVGTTGQDQAMDRVVVNAPDLEVEHYIVGERPAGVSGDVEFVASADAVPQGRTIYSR